MPEPANSVIWIESNVINFFAGKYRQPINLFKWDSNVRAAFGLAPLPRWASLGNELNRQAWMASIHVLIDVESDSWRKAFTVGQITTYLVGLFGSHHNFVSQLRAGNNLSALLETPPKPRKARTPKTANASK
jgi:hypothetical protein